MTNRCPICGGPLPEPRANPNRPFCSARCKMVDLDRWLTGDYYFPGEPAESEPEKNPEIADRHEA